MSFAMLICSLILLPFTMLYDVSKYCLGYIANIQNEEEEFY